jgi:hypothetical protein
VGIDIKQALAQRHETDVAEALAGVATPGSGAGDRKLDVWVGGPRKGFFIVVSAKSTIGKSLPLTEAAWSEAESRAEEIAWDARPALAPRLYGPVRANAQKTSVRLDCVMLGLPDFAEMLRMINEGQR